MKKRMLIEFDSHILQSGTFESMIDSGDYELIYELPVNTEEKVEAKTPQEFLDRLENWLEDTPCLNDGNCVFHSNINKMCLRCQFLFYIQAWKRRIENNPVKSDLDELIELLERNGVVVERGDFVRLDGSHSNFYINFGSFASW